jgi:diadenosine tetraphosphate (Ap4A) HIT family hydrolase
MIDCYACNLVDGTENLIGGLIAETELWRVEHCMGSLGIGTLIVKPKRHILHVWELSKLEAQEMGLLLRQASQVVQTMTNCDQTYVCLWSHAGWTPVHIHYVIQPAYNSQKEQFSNPGPVLQREMFAQKEPLIVAEVEAFCDRAREIWSNFAPEQI